MTIDSPAKLLALSELYKKLEDNYKIVESYRPNPKTVAVTAKFYARHETLSDATKASKEVMDTINYLGKDLKDKVSRPDSVNHSYGWYCNPMVKIDRNDQRFYAPLVSNENTKAMLLLGKDQSLKRPKFQGVPFKL